MSANKPTVETLEPNTPQLQPLPTNRLPLPAMLPLPLTNSDKTNGKNAEHRVDKAPDAKTITIAETIAANAERKANNEHWQFVKSHIEAIENKLTDLNELTTDKNKDKDEDKNQANYDSLRLYLETQLDKVNAINPKIDKSQKLFVAGIKSVLEKLDTANTQPLPNNTETLLNKLTWKNSITPTNILLAANLSIVLVLSIYLIFIK